MKHVAFCCDEAYARYVGVTASSILGSSLDPAGLTFWVFGDGLSGESVERLRRVVEGRGGTLVYREFDRSLVPETAPTHGHISTAAYFRILLPTLLPAEVERVLYLDSDLICEGPIEELIDHPLEGRSLGAVINPGFDRHQTLGIREEWHYLNSGVLLFDLPRWREFGLVEKAVDIMRDRHEILLFHDQDTLNLALEGDWLPLPPRFNCQTSFLRGSPVEGYTAEELRLALTEPRIIHFSSAVKPWQFEGWHPWRWRYFEHLDRTELRGFRPRPRGIRSVTRYFLWRWRLGPGDRPLPAR